MSKDLISLYCKSYRTDLNRTLRLVESIESHNIEKIPFYISVPSADYELFKCYLAHSKAAIICDDDIIKANPKIDLEKIAALHGGTSQQIIKSEFWRLDLSEIYVCLDSDSMFIRPFRQSDFIVDDDTPYTVIDEAHELLESSLHHGNRRFIQNFFDESKNLQSIFKRNGKIYSYGPTPAIWCRKVWESLDKQFLTPNGMSFYDATLKAPLELNWYGEALLKFRAIPLIPSQPLFKVYAFAWQYDADRRHGISLDNLATIYSGVIFQSAWERNMDWPKETGNITSKLNRRVKRLLGRI